MAGLRTDCHFGKHTVFCLPCCSSLFGSDGACFQQSRTVQVEIVEFLLSVKTYVGGPFDSSKKGSNPTSASDDSNGLEWENDFVSAEMDDNGNSEYSGFVNPVLELSDSAIKQSDTDQQIR